MSLQVQTPQQRPKYRKSGQASLRSTFWWLMFCIVGSTTVFYLVVSKYRPVTVASETLPRPTQIRSYADLPPPEPPTIGPAQRKPGAWGLKGGALDYTPKPRRAQRSSGNGVPNYRRSPVTGEWVISEGG